MAEDPLRPPPTRMLVAKGFVSLLENLSSAKLILSLVAMVLVYRAVELSLLPMERREPLNFATIADAVGAIALSGFWTTVLAIAAGLGWAAFMVHYRLSKRYVKSLETRLDTWRTEKDPGRTRDKNIPTPEERMKTRVEPVQLPLLDDVVESEEKKGARRRRAARVHDDG